MATNSIGARVKMLRRQHQLTQGQLAIRARVSRSWLSVIETRGIVEGGSAKMERLARALGVTPHYLLYGSAVTSQEMVPVEREKAGLVSSLSTLSHRTLALLMPLARTLEDGLRADSELIEEISGDARPQPQSMP